MFRASSIFSDKVIISVERFSISPFNSEIISADSRQFYQEMSIGTAVPSKEELSEAPHHFIQHKSIEESFNVGEFEREAISKIAKLHLKKPVAILVGGSGLYVKAVSKGLDYFPEVKATIRAQLNKQFEEEGIAILRYHCYRQS